jgi:hypothetical protein
VEEKRRSEKMWEEEKGRSEKMWGEEKGRSEKMWGEEKGRSEMMWVEEKERSTLFPLSNTYFQIGFCHERRSKLAILVFQMVIIVANVGM